MGEYVRGIDKSSASVRKEVEFGKNYEESDWDHSVEGDAIEGSLDFISREEVGEGVK